MQGVSRPRAKGQHPSLQGELPFAGLGKPRWSGGSGQGLFLLQKMKQSVWEVRAPGSEGTTQAAEEAGLTPAWARPEFEPSCLLLEGLAGGPQGLSDRSTNQSIGGKSVSAT